MIRVAVSSQPKFYAGLNINTIIFNIDGKVYFTTSGGMGCQLYLRRLSKIDNFEIFFMHGDSWGQYGLETDERHFLKLFIEDYKFIDISNYSH